MNSPLFSSSAWIVVIFVATAQSVSARADSMPDLDGIRKVWSARQKKVRYATIKWSDERTVPAHLGATDQKRPDDANSPKYLHVTIPSISLLLGSADGQIRYETEDLDSRIDGRGPFPSQSAFDRQTATTYIPPRDKYGMGIINNKFGDGNLFMKAPLWIFRPMSTKLDSIDLANYRVLPHITRVAGRSCVVLKEDVGRRYAGLSTALYLDTERQLLPVKFVETVNDAIVAQLNISYQPDSRYGWLPKSWEGTLMRQDGQILEAAKSRVLSLRFNEKIDDAAFSIEFPPRTKVADKRSGVEYFIDKDGARQRLPNWGADPEASENETSRTSVWRALLLGIALVLAIVVIVIIARRVRQSPKRVE